MALRVLWLRQQPTAVAEVSVTGFSSSPRRQQQQPHRKRFAARYSSYNSAFFCSFSPPCVPLFPKVAHKSRPFVFRRIGGGPVAALYRPIYDLVSATPSSTNLGDTLDEKKPLPAAEISKEQSAAVKKNLGEKYLLGKSEEELIKLSLKLGEQKYRGRQIHQLIYKTKAKHIDEFHHIPKVLKEALVTDGWQVGRSPIHHIARSTDGTVKVLLRLEDNRLIETVGIPVYGGTGKIVRLTACVSSQVGCALKCTFCATGKGGFARNLKPHEIIEQVTLLQLWSYVIISTRFWRFSVVQLIENIALLEDLKLLIRDEC